MGRVSRDRKVSKVSSGKIQKGDTVQMLLGKDHGRSGQVEKVLSKKGQVLVAGINTVKRHVGKKATGMEGGIIDIIKPVNISNVVLICPNCQKPTRVGFKKEGDEKVRVCKKCGKVVK